MRKKTLLAVAVCAAALASVSVDAALAGEITGNGNKEDYSQGHSLCSFSGQNDDPEGLDPANGPGGRVQSYGYSFVREGLKAVVPSPGEGCNPSL
jgi:hypothetical protein